MIKLLYSENLKIYARVNTLIMMAALLLAALIAMAGDRLFSQLALNYWTTVAGQSWVMVLIKIFAIIVAGGIVANEHAWGTIKLLLIRSVSRGKILLAKYLSVIIFIVTFMSLLLLVLMLSNLLVFAFGNSAAGAAEQAGVFKSFGDAIAFYLARFVDMLIYATIAFMLSAVSKSNAFAIGVSFFVMLLGPESANMIAGKSWSRYYLFSHTDLTKFLKTGSAHPDSAGLVFSLLVIGVYLTMFYGISWAVFTKRDVLD